MGIYEDIGVRPVINAIGTATRSQFGHRPLENAEKEHQVHACQSIKKLLVKTRGPDPLQGFEKERNHHSSQSFLE